MSKNLESCYECGRVSFCKKRKRSVEWCFVFPRRTEFRGGGIYLLGGTSEEAYRALVKQAFQGMKGLFLGEKVDFAGGRPAPAGVEVMRLTHRRRAETDLNLRDPEAILGAVQRFLGKAGNAVVVIDSLEALVGTLGLRGTLRLLSNLNDMVASTPSFILIREGSLDGSELSEIRELIAGYSMDYIIKSVSNPRRKEILERLRQLGKASFSELYKDLGYKTPPKLSFHLKILKDAGVVEQDKTGTYYISALGREVDNLLKRMQEKVIRGLPAANVKVEEEFDRYSWYKDLIKKSGAASTLDVLQGIEDSVELIFGREKSREILRTVFAEFIEGEKEMEKEDLRRAISEIAFVFLVDLMPLVDSIDWADELLVRHRLK
jgi:DNA-binding transcriptional ArsR family regulator